METRDEWDGETRSHSTQLITCQATNWLSGQSHHRNAITMRHYVTKQSVPRWWGSCWVCRWWRDSLWNSLRPQTHGTQTRPPQPQTCVLEGPRKTGNLQSLIEPLQERQKIPVKLKLVSQRMYQEQEVPSLPSKVPQTPWSNIFLWKCTWMY